MRPNQRKLSFAVVKAVHIAPSARVVASFASRRGAIGPFPCHALGEFSVVWIGVASAAGTIRKVEWDHLLCASHDIHFVAIIAGNCQVCSGQHKFGFPVLC